MKKFIKSLLFFALIASAFTACDKNEIPEGKGEVSIKLTDAPFPFEFVAEANIGIAKVELKNASGEYVTFFETAANATSGFNLVNYTNGTTATVETNTIEAGTYTHARVTFGSASVHLNGSVDNNGDNTIFDFGHEVDGSYEVAINPVLEVEEGEHSEVLFDVDVNRTFQFQGNWIFGEWINFITDITGCSFHPAIRVCDLDQTGEISGQVTVNGHHAENVHVTVNVDGHEIASHTEADGTYTFIGIKAGNYTVQVQVDGQGTMHSHQVTVNGTGTGVCDFTIN